MRFLETVKPRDARQKIVRGPVHDLFDFAPHIGMQATEIGDPGGGTHSTEESIALDQDRLSPVARRRDGGGNAGRSAAEDGNLVISQHRRLSARLEDRFRHAMF